MLFSWSGVFSNKDEPVGRVGFQQSTVIDVFNERDVLWAVGTRTHWDKDLDVIRKVQTFRDWLGDAVAIIDATRPLDGDFPKRNEVPQEVIDRVNVSKYLK